MSIVKTFVGLDYHQGGVQVCILNSNGETVLNRKVKNCEDAIIRVIRRQGEPAGLAVEACCGAADLADQLHGQTGWSVSLAHPGFVSRMKQNPDKTDFGDARLLADLLRVGYLPKVWLAPSEIRELRRLVRYRQQVVDQRRNTKLRIRALLRENRITCPLHDVSAWTKPWLHWVRTTDALSKDDRWLMDQHLDQLERCTTSIQATEGRLKERSKGDAVIGKLMECKGVGLITATIMRAEIGRFDRFRSGKQLSRFCGLSPQNASSGERQADAGIIKAGNRQLRTALVQLGHRIINHLNSRWEQLIHRLLQQGKPRNVVVVAVANRFVRWLYHQMQPANLAA